MGRILLRQLVGHSLAHEQGDGRPKKSENARLKRVIISGVGAVSGLGGDVPSLIEGIRQGRSAVRFMDGWDELTGLKSLVAAPAELVNPKAIPRKYRRTMGRMSLFAAQAAQQALKDARIEDEARTSGRMGCIIGSTMGGAQSIFEAYDTILPERNITNLTSTKFFQCVSHTAAMNVAQLLGITGCVMATSAACASALQAIGVGYDLIRLGRQDLALCGGAEELHPTVTGIFDVLMATSTNYNNEPQKTPRPFDKDRDGLVCGEGSGMIVLEEYDHARRREAKVYGEIIGYNTCGSGAHISQSNSASIISCLSNAMKDAGISPADVDYINAHATATLQGDKEEAKAISQILGDNVPVSSLKGHIGHTLGASGALELIVSLAMMAEGAIFPTLNLVNVDPDCSGPHHVINLLRRKIDIFIKNCFAFGGINAALVCKKAEN